MPPASPRPAKPANVGLPADRFGMRLSLRVGIPGSFSSFEVAAEYESSPEEGEDHDALARRVAKFVRNRLGVERDRVFKELDLLDDGKPRKGKVTWR